MPTIGWIDALRTYNAGMPSWCVPRKGTPGYERVMRIRTGEDKAKTFKELTAELERKTGGKPKAEKKSVTINLAEDTQAVKVPTISAEAPKTEVSTKKSSNSNNKKAMAVVPVNYVAEGGSKKVAEEAPKTEEKVAEGGSKKASIQAPPGATMNDLYYPSEKATDKIPLWREDADRWVRIGEWTGKGDTLTFKTGPALVRDKVTEVKVKGISKSVQSMKGFKVGKKVTQMLPFNSLSDKTKNVARTVLEPLGYTEEGAPKTEKKPAEEGSKTEEKPTREVPKGTTTDVLYSTRETTSLGQASQTLWRRDEDKDRFVKVGHWVKQGNEPRNFGSGNILVKTSFPAKGAPTIPFRNLPEEFIKLATPVLEKFGYTIKLNEEPKTEEKPAEMDLPPLLTPEGDHESHLKLLREYKKKGVLWDMEMGNKGGESEHQLYVYMPDKTYHKIAIVTYHSRADDPDGVVRVAFKPIKKRMSLSQEDFYVKGDRQYLMKKNI